MSYNTALLVTDADITKSSRSPEDQKPTAAGLKLTLTLNDSALRAVPPQIWWVTGSTASYETKAAKSSLV